MGAQYTRMAAMKQTALQATAIRLPHTILREKNELCIINSVNAAIALGEATARAVQRIPDAHCNGDMHAALDYAQKVKHEQKNFLNEQALKHIIEEGEQTS